MGYRTLAVSGLDDLIFGRSPRPVRCGFGLTIGAGTVYPEVNFTLPPMSISEQTWTEVVRQYEEIAKTILRRGIALRVPGLVLELELLPAMTETPEWGAQITALLKEHLASAHEHHALPCALRVTPTDIRDQQKPPELRGGSAWERLRRSINLCLEAGADVISIESVGGKEVHDAALLRGDLRGIAFALAVLAPRDVAWLWDGIAGLCRSRAIPGGDSACGFANTAMQLAQQKMLPEVLAAVVRAMSAARTLVAFEHGAVGPSKDCAYEGPVLKAITGCPISMEGKSAACAHFSPLGNIAAAVCDLWSNESVQNVRLLSGNAPEAFTELLVYDCRLLNVAASRGQALLLRDWLTESDRYLSPQAALLSPSATMRVAGAVVSSPDDYQRTLAAARAAVGILREEIAGARLVIPARELRWLDRIEAALDTMPTEDELIDEMSVAYKGVFAPDSYGLPPLISVPREPLQRGT